MHPSSTNEVVLWQQLGKGHDKDGRCEGSHDKGSQLYAVIVFSADEYPWKHCGTAVSIAPAAPIKSTIIEDSCHQLLKSPAGYDGWVNGTRMVYRWVGHCILFSANHLLHTVEIRRCIYKSVA